MKNHYESNPKITALNLTAICNTHFRTKLLFTCLLSILFNINSRAQGYEYVPVCQEFTGAVFVGGSTLCETYSSFDPDFTITNGTYSSNLPYVVWPYTASNFAFSNVEILIQGIFYIDAPVAFINCKVKLAPGAQIIV